MNDEKMNQRSYIVGPTKYDVFVAPEEGARPYLRWTAEHFVCLPPMSLFDAYRVGTAIDMKSITCLFGRLSQIGARNRVHSQRSI